MTELINGKSLADWSHICMKVCGGACCTHVAWGLTSPLTNDDFNRMRVALLHPSISFFIEHGIWHLHVRTVCGQLLPDKACKTYPTRPQICRDYEPGACEWPDGLDWELAIHTDSQLQDYLHKRWNRAHEVEAIDALAVAAVVAWPIDEPFDEPMVDEIRWAVLHQGLGVYVDAEGDWFLLIGAPWLPGGPLAAVSLAERQTWQHWFPDGDAFVEWVHATCPDLIGVAAEQ